MYEDALCLNGVTVGICDVSDGERLHAVDAIDVRLGSQWLAKPSAA